jgi:hypothetical protein
VLGARLPSTTSTVIVRCYVYFMQPQCHFGQTMRPRGILSLVAYMIVVWNLSTPQDHNHKRFVRTTFVESACGPFAHELPRRDAPLYIKNETPSASGPTSLHPYTTPRTNDNDSIPSTRSNTNRLVHINDYYSYLLIRQDVPSSDA